MEVVADMSSKLIYIFVFVIWVSGIFTGIAFRRLWQVPPLMVTLQRIDPIIFVPLGRDRIWVMGVPEVHGGGGSDYEQPK
jgi:hypothetical protein